VKKTCAQRETLIIAGCALDGTKFDGIYLAAVRALICSMRGRSIMASTRRPPPICSRG
jgi:hypothetical protein